MPCCQVIHISLYDILSENEQLLVSTFIIFTDHFSGPGRQSVQCVCVCVFVQTVTFEVNRYLARWFNLTVSKSSSKVQRSRS